MEHTVDVRVYRCHCADLANVLLVTLRTCGSTRRSSAVPEGVVILERVFSYSRTHRLRQAHTNGSTRAERDMEEGRAAPTLRLLLFVPSLLSW